MIWEEIQYFSDALIGTGIIYKKHSDPGICKNVTKIVRAEGRVNRTWTAPASSIPYPGCSIRDGIKKGCYAVALVNAGIQKSATEHFRFPDVFAGKIPDLLIAAKGGKHFPSIAVKAKAMLRGYRICAWPAAFPSGREMNPDEYTF
jgi:hypothetical protein